MSFTLPRAWADRRPDERPATGRTLPARAPVHARLRRALAVGTLSLIGLITPPAQAQTQALRLGGTGAALPALEQLARLYRQQHPDHTLTVLPSLGSGGGIKALLAGAVQIAVSARPLSEAERQAGATSQEYARTPLAFAVPANVGVQGLSTAQVIDLYAGRIETWPDGTRVRLVLRPDGDSDSALLDTLSPAMREARRSAALRGGLGFAVTDQECADTLEKVRGAFGPLTLAQLQGEQRALRPLALNGVTPGPASVADRSYPLIKSFYLVTGPQSGAAAGEFVAFTRSAPARALLARTGHWVP